LVHRSFNPRSGRFDVTLDLPAGASRKTLRLTGVARETVEAAVLMRPLARGEILRASDIVVERRPKAETASNALADPHLIVGLAARQTLRVGHALRQTDLIKPELVQRNETVVLVYQVPGILLTLRGK